MSKTEKIVAVKGMNDILPGDSHLWQLFENTAQSVVQSYGFQQIRTPIVEDTSLFARAIGAVTDIVEKEIYSFEDAMNGDKLTLRPLWDAAMAKDNAAVLAALKAGFTVTPVNRFEPKEFR